MHMYIPYTNACYFTMSSYTSIEIKALSISCCTRHLKSVMHFHVLALKISSGFMERYICTKEYSIYKLRKASCYCTWKIWHSRSGLRIK